jgi:hypothetical protein
MWAVFTALLTIGAYYIDLPAFLAFAFAGSRVPARGHRPHHGARE